MDLSQGGRLTRLVVTVALVVGVVVANQWGSDDDFPFAPFKMYSSSRALDEPVGNTQIVGVDAAGEEVPLTEAASGLRRAEFEGQLPRFEADPQLLGLVAEAYGARNPTREPLDEISIFVEWNELEDGVVTGRTWTEDVVSWER